VIAAPAQSNRSTAAQLTDPNHIARKLTGRDYLSYSALSTYQTCSLRYFFRYVAGVSSEFVSSSLIFGGAIHSAIELHFRRMFEGAAAPSIDELMIAYEQAWKSRNTLPIRFGKNESVESLRDLARRMLIAFQLSEVSKLDTRLIAIEEEFRSPVVSGCPDLLGRVDLLAVDRAVLRIVDFKTSRSRWSEAKMQDAAPQMLMYSELARPIATALGVRELRLEWVVLTKTKNPVVETHSLTVDLRQIARTKNVVRRVWNAIRGGHFYPSPSPMNCSTCAYRQACRNWKGA